MSEKRLAEIRERLEKTSPGPWGYDLNGTIALIDEDEWGQTVTQMRWNVLTQRDHDNAEFIANAPTDIAFLLDGLAAAKAQLAQSILRFVAKAAQQAIDGHQGTDAYYCGYRDALGHFTDAGTLAKIFNAAQASPLLKPGEREK